MGENEAIIIHWWQFRPLRGLHATVSGMQSKNPDLPCPECGAIVSMDLESGKSEPCPRCGGEIDMEFKKSMHSTQEWLESSWEKAERKEELGKRFKL